MQVLRRRYVERAATDRAALAVAVESEDWIEVRRIAHGNSGTAQPSAFRMAEHVPDVERRVSAQVRGNAGLAPPGRRRCRRLAAPSRKRTKQSLSRSGD